MARRRAVEIALRSSAEACSRSPTASAWMPLCCVASFTAAAASEIRPCRYSSTGSTIT